tara:strand:- start:679 stop:1356 length:678 start_codon:yes stop_codon:yes gene_type:complete
MRKNNYLDLQKQHASIRRSEMGYLNRKSSRVCLDKTEEKNDFPEKLNSNKIRFLKSKIETGIYNQTILRQLANELDYQNVLTKWHWKMNSLNLPKELQIKILEYDSNHRKIFKSSLEKIPSKVALHICNNAIDEWAKKYRYSIRQVQFINQKIQDKEFVFKCLQKCNCCERHQTNRPVYGNYPEYNAYNQDSHFCKCRCRQNMRILSRSRFFEINGFEPTPPWQQ